MAFESTPGGRAMGDKVEGPVWLQLSAVPGLRGMCDKNTLMRWLKNGTLRGKKLGLKWYIHKDDASEFMARPTK